MKYRQVTKKIGILGGGQLARMLALSAHSLGYTPVILSPLMSDPAAQVVKDWIAGDPADAMAQKRLFAAVDVATFESEFLDGQILQKTSKSKKTPVFPRPLLMEKLRDRLSQKKLLVQHKVPTASYFLSSTPAALKKNLRSHPRALVFKSRTGGYDGYGTFIIDDPSENLPSPILQEPSGYIAEKKIAFRRELAVSFVRNHDGELISLPWVESHQENARCDWVKGPIKSKRFEPFADKLRNFVHEIGYVGAIAFEIFDTGKELLVNEIAPRVHNSAHYSMDGLIESQFVLHIKAVAGDHLHPPELVRPGFAMANLLGQQAAQVKIPVSLKGNLHWYGKGDNRQGRKMGHLNTLGSSAEAALELALKERRKIIL